MKLKILKNVGLFLMGASVAGTLVLGYYNTVDTYNASIPDYSIHMNVGLLHNNTTLSGVNQDNWVSATYRWSNGLVVNTSQRESYEVKCHNDVTPSNLECKADEAKIGNGDFTKLDDMEVQDRARIEFLCDLISQASRKVFIVDGKTSPFDKIKTYKYNYVSSFF